MRAQVVLLRGDEILLARHLRGDYCYWVLPGGAVEFGESPEDAAVREVREETGLEIRVERLLFVDGPRQAPGVEIRRPRYTYLARVVGGELEFVTDRVAVEPGGNSSHGYLSGAAWMPFDWPELDAATRDTLDLVRLYLRC